jgi:hypothetical protein
MSIVLTAPYIFLLSGSIFLAILTPSGSIVQEGFVAVKSNSQ